MTNTNAITRAIITYGNLSGYCLWRNNNGAVYSVKRQTYMKNPAHKLGVPDIIGYRKSDGKFVSIEIKTGKDKLSEEQLVFISDAVKATCIAFVARDVESAIKVLNINR